MSKENEDFTEHLSNAVKEHYRVDTKLLKELAMYLEGIKKGQGNLYPLGEIHLS